MEKPAGGFVNPKKILISFDVKKGMKAADFGCGSGYFSIALAKAVGPEGRVVAIDVLPSALELVEARAKNDFLFNIETKRANLEILGGSGLPDNSEDLILLANILRQTESKKGVMAEAKRTVKPDGQIIVIDYQPVASKWGPEEKTRISPAIVKSLAQGENLKLIKEFSAGDYHWGLILKKN